MNNCKIISVNQNNALSGIDIAAKKDILVPCNMFTISIPKENRSLDIISETIFHFCAYQRDYNKIAEKCCIDKELVKFIQNKLFINGYLTENYDLSENGKILLQELENTKDKEIEYEVATVLLDLISGNIIKKIFRGDEIQKYLCKQNEKTEEDKKDVDFFVGSTGKSQNYRAKVLNIDKKFENRKPEIKQISQFVKGGISIQEKNPELVYIHCIAAYQNGNYDDFLVTDGIGKGFSKKLSTADNFALHDVMQYLLSNVETKNLSDSDFEYTDNKKEVWKYPSITRLLQKCDKVLNSQNDKKEVSKNKEKTESNKLADAIIDLHKAVEQFLYQIVIDNPDESWKNLLSSKNHNEIGKLLCGICDKLGYKINDEEKRKFSIPAGKFKNEIPIEMYPLLALCIGTANNKVKHPLNLLTHNFKNLFKEIYDLNLNRDSNAHGGKANKEREWLERKFQYFQKVIVSIYPEALAYDKKYKAAKEIDNTLAKAKKEMYKEFGVATIRNAPQKLSALLEKVFVARENLTEEIFTQYIMDTSGCLQMVLYLQYSNEIQLSDNLPTKQDCLRKIRCLQFVTEIPKSLEKVNEKRFERAVQGEDVTLGANLLAMFGILENKKLNEIKEKVPNLIEVTMRMAELRGHGNQEIEFSEQNKEFTNIALNIIKKILED